MMKFKKIIIIMLSLLFLIGCSAENTTYPNGGDNGNNSGIMKEIMETLFL